LITLNTVSDKSIIQVWTNKILPSSSSTSLGSEKFLAHPQVDCTSLAAGGNRRFGQTFPFKQRIRQHVYSLKHRLMTL